ncbi:unnamed protein product [Owenia fusiformis]|uniref:Uncharacterized protein n=1 Tax=Owenia fusiformis TaxID=6347 RepID=A0A8S4Q5E2_OWEFU|nr:unnamed protein product [Owenia fusiformis]
MCKGGAIEKKYVDCLVHDCDCGKWGSWTEWEYGPCTAIIVVNTGVVRGKPCAVTGMQSCTRTRSCPACKTGHLYKRNNNAGPVDVRKRTYGEIIKSPICIGESVQGKTLQCCKIRYQHCVWSTWSAWSYGTCSRSCSIGSVAKHRTRSKQLMASDDPDGPQTCKGSHMEQNIDICNTQECLSKDCVTWGEWTPWEYGECYGSQLAYPGSSPPCRILGLRQCHRTRVCPSCKHFGKRDTPRSVQRRTYGSEIQPGRCVGQTIEYKSDKCCKGHIDEGQWQPWTSWACTADCSALPSAGGRRKRDDRMAGDIPFSKECLEYGIHACIRIRKCATRTCEGNEHEVKHVRCCVKYVPKPRCDKWSSWSAWSCPATCTKLVFPKIRRRSAFETIICSHDYGTKLCERRRVCPPCIIDNVPTLGSCDGNKRETDINLCCLPKPTTRPSAPPSTTSKPTTPMSPQSCVGSWSKWQTPQCVSKCTLFKTESSKRKRDLMSLDEDFVKRSGVSCQIGFYMCMYKRLCQPCILGGKFVEADCPGRSENVTTKLCCVIAPAVEDGPPIGPNRPFPDEG